MTDNMNHIKTVIDLNQHGFSSTVADTVGGGIYNNGKVAITKDLIFGLCVWNGDEWVPVSEGSEDEKAMIRRLVDGDPLFLWHEEVRA